MKSYSFLKLEVVSKKHLGAQKLIVCFYFGLVLFLSIHFPSIAYSRDIFITIGTGSTTGVYYATGEALAKIVNRTGRKEKLQVKFVSTGGSVFNINAIMAGDLELGIVQSDRQYQAWNGTKDWKDRGSQKKLRSICSLYSESVVLIAGNDTGITTLNDLKGKIVNINNLGSGPRGNAIDTMQSCGIDWRRELTAEGIRAAESAKLLQDGSIDAFFYTVGHPSDSIKEALNGNRKAYFIPLTGECIDRLIDEWPYYTRSNIPIRFYPSAGNKKNIETFSVKATLCTSTDISDKVIYTITKIIFENLEEFKKLHPAYSGIIRNNMLEALSAPIHKGAMKYYKETGLTIP